ncbi:MAG: hypothetical protein KDD35_12780 [Bdellovibrionales bacterium]|nr:hypothetical protein [Bdellovibrionales bacterium]
MIKPILKNSFTVAYLVVTFIVTAATSKKGDSTYSSAPDRITNYHVASNCSGAIADSRIRVNGQTIIDASFPPEYYDDGSDGPGGHRNFDKFGFSYAYLSVGEDEIGHFEFEGRNCIVTEKLTTPNEEYNSSLLQYWFAFPGYFTNTVYECNDNGHYKCTISFEELEAVEFNQISYF